jgi:hypothetical protein
MSNEKFNEKIEAFWGNATADDVAGIAKTGKPIPARVRDEDTGHWRQVLLAGWKLARFDPGAIWIDADGGCWAQCQVYREPSWYADKPDPGLGWRLLEKFPDEELKPGDECFGLSGEWGSSCQAKAGGHQVFGMWYRRRIEAVKPVEHYLGRVEAIKQFIVGDTFWHPNGLLLKVTEKGFEVTQ